MLPEVILAVKKLTKLSAGDPGLPPIGVVFVDVRVVTELAESVMDLVLILLLSTPVTRVMALWS